MARCKVSVFSVKRLLPKSHNSEFEPKPIQLNVYSVMEIEAESLSHRCFFGVSSWGAAFQPRSYDFNDSNKFKDLPLTGIWDAR